MIFRRRGRIAGLAVAVTIGALVVVACGGSRVVTVRDADDGRVLISVPIEDDAGVTLRYRNSLYGTTAEERFEVTTDGRLDLTMLAADQLAVLEEYYAIAAPAWRAPAGDSRVWLATPAQPVHRDELVVAATELGERTLLVAGQAPVLLFRLEGADPTVILGVEDR